MGAAYSRTVPRISAWVEEAAAKKAHLLDREASCRAPGDARPPRKLQAASARSSEGTSQEICDTNTICIINFNNLILAFQNNFSNQIFILKIRIKN